MKWPAIAVAAATAGETRCVRPPLPCLPSKFRFDVEALRSPGCRMSGFIPRHIEHPAPRQSNPASTKIRSRPSRSACSFTATEPGTTSARSPWATLRPSTTAAARRRSSIREFVQDPMKTVSGRMSRILVPGSRAMYARARRAASRFAWSSKESGSGTASSIVTDWAGFVPHETCGRRRVASIVTSASKVAPASVGSERQSSRARSQSAPDGACGLPST